MRKCWHDEDMEEVGKVKLVKDSVLYKQRDLLTLNTLPPG